MKYYMQDRRQYVGNCMLWWAKDCNGYTTDIDKAEIFSKKDAIEIANNRKTDIPWEKEYIDKRIKKHVDMQYCDNDFSGIQTSRTQCKEPNKSNIAKNL